jgi:hypothetical protein
VRVARNLKPPPRLILSKAGLLDDAGILAAIVLEFECSDHRPLAEELRFLVRARRRAAADLSCFASLGFR